MKSVNFIFDSIYQIVTWVFIACAIAALFYCLSKGNTRGVIWSFVGLICSVVVMIGIIADDHFFRSDTATPVGNRPYVFISETALMEPLIVGDKPVFMFALTNSGQTEAIGRVEDVTFFFSVNPGQRSFDYRSSKPVNFHLVPTEKWSGQIRVEFVLTQEKIKALDARKARLFFYGRIRYGKSAVGNHVLPFCFVYDPEVPLRLARCDDDIEIKQPSERSDNTNSEPSG